MQSTSTVTVVPDKSFYHPGETVTLSVSATDGTHVEATIMHLAETVAVLDGQLNGGSAALTWTPPRDAPRGYGLTLRLFEGDAVIANASTAFDVLERWTQAPRYGFLSEFQPGRDDAEATMDWLVRYHINGLQFYDWQYRHEALLPPADSYTDPLGRRLSLATVKYLIDAAHTHNIATMPYTAIYGASPAFFQQHRDWALFQATGEPFEFGDGFLYIMDPSPDSPWSEHLLSEFARVLDETTFDGIHIDQYGAPQVGQNATGERVDLAEAFPAFIDQTAALVHEKRGDAGTVIFNAVRNWPVDTVAPADQDVVYIEVWEPYRDFMDLHRLVTRAQTLGNGKPVILAAYMHPDHGANVRLANAIVFASGGYHLELGEPKAMLADPYFPKFGRMGGDTQALMRRYYDFLVRYENRLALGTQDATGDRRDAVQIEGVETHSRQGYDQVAVVVRQGGGFETFSLINLLGLEHGYWEEALPAGPTPQTNLAVRISVSSTVAGVWAASPDSHSLPAQTLTFTTETDDNGSYVAFTLPGLDYWQMIVLDYGA